MTRPRKIPAQAGFEPGTFRSRGGRLTTRPTRRSFGETSKKEESNDLSSCTQAMRATDFGTVPCGPYEDGGRQAKDRKTLIAEHVQRTAQRGWVLTHAFRSKADGFFSVQAN